MHGTVFGGQQPVVGSTIQVWVVGKGTTAAAYGAGATVLGTPVTSTAGGSFSYGAYTCTNASDPVYITATGGTPGGFTANANLMLMASLGPCSSAASQTVNITEVTTAASAFAMSHFFTTTLGASSTNAFGGEASVGYNDGLLNANAYTARLLAPVNLGVAATTKTAGSLTTTTPVLDKNTFCQIPVSRSRIAGSQSHPIVARNVGPSTAVSPPFFPSPSRIVCSCETPGCGCGDTLTASTILAPALTTEVTSNRPRANAPFISPTRTPFTQIADE